MSETKTNVRLMFCFANHGASSESLYSCSESILSKVWLVLMCECKTKSIICDRVHDTAADIHPMF